MKEIKYFLIKEYTIFIDPHGDIDDGGMQKRVASTLSDKDLQEQIDAYFPEKEDYFTCDVYNEEGEWAYVDEEYFEGSEDGYNASYEHYTYKEISKEEYDKFVEIIQVYNSL